MPYIEKKNRGRFEDAIRDIGEVISCVGDINYVFTRILNDTIERQGISYTLLNELIGVLECAKLELYRRKVAPYEDVKIAENGDV